MLEEIEREMGGGGEFIPQQQQQYSQTSAPQSSSSYLPHGAMPSINGKLTKNAAEFWFPECRNCECCTGYKHGCKCCVGGVTQCSCVSGGAPVASSTSSAPVTSAPVSSSSPKKSTTSYLPSGAVPTMGGKLTKAAAEFWFPECRNCECCVGYKHGCKCCVGGVTQCSCLNTVTETVVADTTTSVSTESPPASTTSTTESAKVASEPVEDQSSLWYKNARDCSCCKGFRHKCSCVSNDKGSKCAKCTDM